MKKSEMISTIADALVEADVNLSQEEILKLSDTLLDRIEEKGMKPPDHNHFNEEYGVWDYWEEE